mmetsp:Transcript_4284/g.18276  ORF Transcript_4284/g.18276 Transcript_4284/m.18276 type:complete len:104 (-) Transcript_4284:3606-3917(-)
MVFSNLRNPFCLGSDKQLAVQTDVAKKIGNQHEDIPGSFLQVHSHGPEWCQGYAELLGYPTVHTSQRRREQASLILRTIHMPMVYSDESTASAHSSFFWMFRH